LRSPSLRSMRQCIVAITLAIIAGSEAFIGKESCKEMTCTNGVNNLPKAKWKGSWGSTKYLGSFETVAECEAACVGYKDRRGRTCKSFVWHDVEQEGKCYTRRQCMDSQCFASFSDDWNPIQQIGVVSGRVGLGVASAVNKAFTTLETSIETIPSVFIGDEAGDGGGDKKKSEEKKSRAEEQKKKDAAAKKAADDAKAAKAAEDKKRKEREAASEAKRREMSRAEEAAAAAAKKAKEQKRRESSAKKTIHEEAKQKAQEESRRRAEKEAEKEEARKQKAREDAKRADDAAKAKKSKKSKRGVKETGGATFGVEGLDMLLSASSTRVSISVAILAILTSYFHARRHATTVKHRKIEAELRSRGHITDDGSWLM